MIVHKAASSFVMASLAVAALSGCSSAGDTEATARTLQDSECGAERGSVTDVENEPDWRAYADYRPWTDAEGCLLRIDVLAERSGPAHCGWDDAEVLIAGQPLGEAYTSPDDSVQFVRDPEGVFQRPDLVDGYSSDTAKPEVAIDSGFRRGKVSLWHVPGDQRAVWLVSNETTERWPRGDTPLCE